MNGWKNYGGSTIVGSTDEVLKVVGTPAAFFVPITMKGSEFYGKDFRLPV